MSRKEISLFDTNKKVIAVTLNLCIIILNYHLCIDNLLIDKYLGHMNIVYLCQCVQFFSFIIIFFVQFFK